MSVSTCHHTGPAFRAAEAFAEAIHATPEWEEWESARAAARTDPELQQLFARRRTLSDQSYRASGSALESINAELERVRQLIAHTPASVRQQAAVAGLIELLRTLNITLSGALGVDFVQLAAPLRGNSGCCGQPG